MAHNFQRPDLPYEGESLQNDQRYELLTRANHRGPRDDMFDTDFNYLIDAVRQLDEDIANIEAGIIQGSDDPENANLLLTTDGAANLSWTDVSDENVRERSLSGSRLLPGTLTAFEMMDGTLTAPKLAPNCVTTVKMLDFNVTANKLAPDAVTTIKILDENVTTPKIADEAITSPKIADDAVTTPKILDANVTAPKIADSNITTQKIADLNVTTPKLADGSVTLPKIGPNVLTPPAVKADQIAGNSTAVYTNPAVQQHHPSASKAWVRFNGTNGTIISAYNVSSVSRNSAGNYTITFSTPFADTAYLCVGNSEISVLANLTYVVRHLATLSTTQSRIQIIDDNGDLVDTASISLVFFGLQ